MSPAALEQTYGAPMEVLAHLGIPSVLDRFQDIRQLGTASS